MNRENNDEFAFYFNNSDLFELNLYLKILNVIKNFILMNYSTDPYTTPSQYNQYSSPKPNDYYSTSTPTTVQRLSYNFPSKYNKRLLIEKVEFNTLIS